jgi:hypothetical protein
MGSVRSEQSDLDLGDPDNAVSIDQLFSPKRSGKRSTLVPMNTMNRLE